VYNVKYRVIQIKSPQRQKREIKMKNAIIDIRSNGSKWYGQLPDSIDILMETLDKYTLDPTFEDFGNFIYPFIPAKGWNSENEKYKGCTCISGNFLTYSHVFSIITNDNETIEKLSSLIRNNQQREEYKETKNEIDVDKKLKMYAQEKFNNKTIDLKQLHNFASSLEGEMIREQIKSKMLITA